MRILIALLFALLAASAHAQQLSAQDAADVARAEQYLNGLTTLKARFVQIGPKGEVAEGDFYLSRPNRLRFEYDPPAPILVVGDGLRLVYYDKQLEQENAWPIGATPLGPLVARTVAFAKGVRAVQREAGALRIALVDPDNPDQGTLTLVFSDNPLELRQWTVKDAQGLNTTVTLNNLAANVPVDPALFFLPERAERR